MTEAQARKLVMELDLTNVRKSLLKPKWDGGMGWTDKYAARVEMLYRGFLFVCWKFKNKEHVPSRMVDMYWHTHILYTKDYRAFCKKLYGKYLDHTPNPKGKKPL